MFKILDHLIDALLSSYFEINTKWKSLEGIYPFNLKKKTIADIQNNNGIWENILAYRKYMAIQQLEILQKINNIQSDENRITVRIKQLNSIEYKFSRYNTGDLKGKVPINKCLNDLFGVRIIIDSSFTHDDLADHLKAKYSMLKLTNASKNGYIASHLYFMMDNQLFPWELQIWQKQDEMNNLASHKLYKQDYTSWENNYKNN